MHIEVFSGLLVVPMLLAPAMFCSAFGQSELRLLVAVPMTGHIRPNGQACSVPIKIAVEMINDRPDLLDGYHLTFDIIDTENIPGRAVYKMERNLYQNKPYLIVLGPFMSITCMPLAEVSWSWNVTYIGFACASPSLSDRVRFPRFFRMGFPDSNNNGIRIALMKKFNWNQIATLHAADEYFSVVMERFVKDAIASGLNIITQQVFLYDPTSQVKNLKDEDVRIIMTAMYEDRARAVLCAAYRIGYYGPKIVWLFLGYYHEYFWQVADPEIPCTIDEMNKAAEGAFLVKPVDGNIREVKSFANLTYTEFINVVRNHPEYIPETSTYDRNTKQCFDGIWTAALALNCTIEHMQRIGHPKTLDQFNYDKDISDIVFYCVGNTSMMGVGAYRHFPDGANSVQSVVAERVQGGKRERVGYHWKYEPPYYFQWFDENLKWKDGKIPRDSTIVRREEVTIPVYLYTTMCVLAALGIMLCTAFFAFNILYRSNKTVKLSSPNVNNALLFGCLLCYMTVFFKNIEVTSPQICQVRVICLTLGFTITFGSLFSKTWRVYKIFTNSRLARVSIKDSQLFAMNGALVGVVFLVVLIWEITAPHEVNVRVLHKEIFTYGNDEEIHPFVQECHSTFSSQFAWTIYILEGTLLAFGAFLAWETRKVKIEALNDSQEIGLCLYNVVILSAVGLTLSLILEDRLVLLYGVTSASLIIGTTLTQAIVFTTKVRAVVLKVGTEEATVALPGGSSNTSARLSKKQSATVSTNVHS